MKSYDVVDWGKPLQAHVRDTPTPRGTEVLLKLTHCGVCHTDVHVRDGAEYTRGEELSPRVGLDQFPTSRRLPGRKGMSPFACSFCLSAPRSERIAALSHPASWSQIDERYFGIPYLVRQRLLIRSVVRSAVVLREMLAPKIRDHVRHGVSVQVGSVDHQIIKMRIADLSIEILGNEIRRP